MPPLTAPLADDDLPDVAYFSVHARAEPGVMPRILDLFAKRGLVPSVWRSTTAGADHGELRIDIQVRGLDRATADYIGACLRQIVFVDLVLTASG